MAKPITPKEMRAWIKKTWDICQQEAWQEQEPVAWMHNFIEGNVITHKPVDIGRYPERWTPLYTAPPSIEAAVLAEREACAKVCEDMEEKAEEYGTECCKWPTPIDCACTIRARGEK